jgi:hypothetical protein
VISRLIFFLIALSYSHAAHAGPWLREKGSTFMAVSLASTYYMETTSQTYLEYGLTKSTTLIADVSMARYHYGSNSGYATLSLRRSITPPDAQSKWAYELGVGAGWTGTETLPHVRTGLSWGRGMKWGDKSGWMSVDAAVIWDLTHALHVSKIDTTLGINFTDFTAGMLQIYTAHVATQNTATLAPSLVLSPKNGKFRLQIGSESQFGNLSNSVLKISLWREF